MSSSICVSGLAVLISLAAIQVVADKFSCFLHELTREGEGEGEEEKWRAPDDAFGGDLQALIYKKKALCRRDIIILLVFDQHVFLSFTLYGSKYKRIYTERKRLKMQKQYIYIYN